MAIAGDVVIKLAADFAEFAKGMDEGIKKLDEFGKSASKTGTAVEGFIGTLKKGFAALGIGEAARELLAYGENLQKTTAALATISTTLGLSTDQFQAYKFAAIEAGVSTDAITATVGKFNVAIGQAAQGSKSHLDALNELGVKILDANGKLRSQGEILEEVARKLLALPEGAKRAAAEVVLFGRSGQELNPILDKLALGSDVLIQHFEQLGVLIDQKTIKTMEELERKSALAQARLDALVAPIYAEAKSTILGFVTDHLLSLQQTLESFDLSKLQATAATLYLLLNPLTAVPTFLAGGAISNALFGDKAQRTFDDIATAKTEIDRINASIQALNTRGGDNTARLETLNKELDAATLKYNQATDAAQKFAYGGMAAPTTVTAPAPGGASNPPAVGGPKHHEDPIEAQIRRYGELAKASDAAAATIRRNEGAPIEELQRAVDVQKQVDDIIAKQGTKAGVTDDQRARLLAVVKASAEAADATKKLMDANIAADATERRLGDGTTLHARNLRDLAKQNDTTRLTSLAYSRALVEEAERTADARDAAARLDNNLGSLAAGFDKASRDFAKSNDLFSAGQGIFNGLTNAMGESLDVLVGKSSKSFAQIAQDFALMLAKMALQAALSPVFKAAGGLLSGLFSAGTAAAPAAAVPNLVDFFPFATSLAGGGPTEAGMSYIVGEHGPERFVPGAAGQVVPMGGSGSSSVTVNVDMGQQSGASDPSSAMIFGRKLKAAIVDVIHNEKRPGGTLYQRATA